MTLLASERSLLIRNKFRSVLQLRIQNRRQSEISAESGSKSTAFSLKEQKDKNEAVRLPDDGAAQKMPPGGVVTQSAQEKSDSGVSRQRKSRRVQDLREGIQDPPGPEGHKDKEPPENCPAPFPLSAHAFQDDVSCCSSSSSSSSSSLSAQLSTARDQSQSDLSSAATPLNRSPGHTQAHIALLTATEGISPPTSVPPSQSTTSRPNGSFLISQTTPLLPKTARPPSPSSSPAPAFNLNHLARSRKPRDAKPKMKKLKYHQYIPPDQRGPSGLGGGGAKQKSPPPQPLDPAYSHLVKQQQVFLQLQILQNQHQQHKLTVVPREPNSSGALPLNPHPVPATTNHVPKDTNPASKHELLPANLVDLTVSELRQQLRKRGLPVSGTKPALLQRLRPFQLPPACVTPTPLCQLGGSMGPSTCSSGGGDSPGSSPNQQTYIQDQGVPNGSLNVVSNGLSGGLSITLAGEACSSINAVFLAPACTASGTPSPNLPMSSSSPLQCGTPWVDFDLKERIRDAYTEESCEGSLHPFLQQDPGYSKGKLETDAQAKVLFTEVFCSKPCDMIGQDFELPVQITASPDQNSPGIRSLEEELLEAIQKAQMDPRQSIDDILDEPLASVDSTHKTPVPSPPQVDHALKSQQHSKDGNFLPSPLCSSLLLELPPSPAVIPPGQVTPALTPPAICTSPPLASAAGKSRKRRAQAMFDAADILETLTSGFRPLTPPAAPFGEPGLGLDSDLNINRVLDLMIEQW
ncbi:myocardin [Dunckerocampus dactyliophorus]|uniref:myocardin n=1 Tax=Dunckerocampus dactyliophorus TaxID=161453 RepID=UPI0024071FDA|nr:myocardin [Dunckerocampus dactyliophorus]